MSVSASLYVSELRIMLSGFDSECLTAFDSGNVAFSQHGSEAWLARVKPSSAFGVACLAMMLREARPVVMIARILAATMARVPTVLGQIGAGQEPTHIGTRSLQHTSLEAGTGMALCEHGRVSTNTIARRCDMIARL